MLPVSDAVHCAPGFGLDLQCVEAMPADETGETGRTEMSEPQRCKTFHQVKSTYTEAKNPRCRECNTLCPSYGTTSGHGRRLCAKYVCYPCNRHWKQTRPCDMPLVSKGERLYICMDLAGPPPPPKLRKRKSEAKEGNRPYKTRTLEERMTGKKQAMLLTDVDPASSFEYGVSTRRNPWMNSRCRL